MATGLTLTTANAVLKEDYLPGVREQLNNEGILATIEKNQEDIVGRRAVLAIHYGRNSGVGARSELGNLPNAGAQQYVDEYIPLRYNYARIQVSGQTIKAMASDKGAFVRAVNSEMDGAVNDLKRDMSRQAWGTSDGVIAPTGVTNASTTVNLAGSTVQARFFEQGMVVDIGTVANPTAVVSGATIQSVSVANNTITIDSSVTTTASHKVFRSGAGGSGSSQQELTGLQTIVNNAAGSVFGIDGSTTSAWNAYVDTAGSNRSVQEMTFAKAQQQIHIAGGTDIEVWITSDGVHRAYSALLTGLKRFPQTVDLKGGYKGVAAAAGGTGEVPVTWDRDCPSNSAFGLRLKNLVEFRMSDWEWMNEDGAILQRVIGKDAYEATLFKYAELATDKRNAHGLVNALTEA